MYIFHLLDKQILFAGKSRVVIKSATTTRTNSMYYYNSRKNNRETINLITTSDEGIFHICNAERTKTIN
jgi:hypothetical protein